MTTHVVNAAVARHQAEMMVAAGEFMLAVKTLHEDNEQALNQGYDPILSERTMGGLIAALELVGRKLVTDGVEFIEDDNEMRQGV